MRNRSTRFGSATLGAFSACSILLAGAGCSGDGSTARTGPAAASTAPFCDRACLEKAVDDFLAALVAHDPARIAAPGGMRYIENNAVIEPGTGLWRTIEGLGGYRHSFADPDTSQAALIGIVKENGAEALFTLRLKVDGGRVSEAEAIVTRDARTDNYAKLGKPDDIWLQAAPPEKRLPREALAAVADKYLSAMENNDGKGDYSFFADDCNRLEHGLRTTNNARQNYGHSNDSDFVTMTCRQQFETGFLGFVTRIRDRRYEVIDVERQVVYAIATLDHNGTIRELPMTNGKTFRIPPYFSAPRTLQVGEAFKIVDGKIHYIEMTLHEFPYGMPPAVNATWRPSSEVPGGRAGSAADAACERECLEELTDQLLAAMVAHDPRRAPLSTAVRYTENDQALAIGDGLWGTVTEVGDYRIHIADPAKGRAGFVGRITETDIPGILALRVTVQNRRITEIEATIVREEKPGQDMLFRPRLPIEAEPMSLSKPEPALMQAVAASKRTPRDELLSVVNRYFDAVEKGKGGDVPFASACARRQNGVMATNNPDLPRPPAKGRPSDESMWTAGDAESTAATQAGGFRPYALGCADQLNSGFTSYIERIRGRRELAVDEERGLVFFTAYLDIPGTVKSIYVKGVGSVTLPRILGRPYTIASPHVFKIEGGEIRFIESLDRSLPFGLRSAWGNPNSGNFSAKDTEMRLDHSSPPA